jgi:hypothetical protein
MFAPSCYALCIFLSVAPPLRAAEMSVPDTRKPPLTVLMEFDSPHSDIPLDSVREHLNQLLTPGGIDVDVEIRENLPPNPQFGQLVIFKMKGSCSIKQPAGSPLHSGKPGPLAMAYTSNGQVLHFGEVECDRVRTAMQRVVGVGRSRKNEQFYAAALATVIAHEVYHMLGNATGHTRAGLTKPALSPEELVDQKVGLSSSAISALQAVR